MAQHRARLAGVDSTRAALDILTRTGEPRSDSGTARSAFLQAAKAASLNSGEMYEDIITSLTADEAVAVGVVKPLYCSLFH
jgi:hypothetical protein